MGFFHFLKKEAHDVGHAVSTVARGDSKPGGGVFGFLDKAAQSEANVKQNIQKKTGGSNTVGDKVFHFIKESNQTLAKIPETAVRSTAEVESRVANKFGAHLPTDYSAKVTDPIRKNLYGTDVLKTYQQRGEGVHQAHQNIPAPLAAAGLAGLDITPGGGAKKSLAEQLAKADTVSAVKKLIPGIEDTKAAAIASQKSPHIIDNIIKGENDIPSPAPPIQDIITPDKVLNREVAQKVEQGEVIPPPNANPLADIHAALNGTPATPGQSPVKGIRSVREEQNASLKTQRGQRFGAAKSAGASESGSAGYYKELGQLEGTYDKPKLGGLIENLGPERAEELFSNARAHIQSIPDSVYENVHKTHPGQFSSKGPLNAYTAKLNTQTALRKVIFGEGGGVPTSSELKLLDIADPELAANVRSKIPKSRKLMDLAAQLAGIPRALKATLDLSMGGRQGILVAARHPKIWGVANKESAKMFKSSEYYHQEMAGLRARPSYGLADRYGLKLPAAEGMHEEAYASSDLAEKIPVAKHAILASSRAYDGGLARMRMDLWDNMLSKFGGVEKAHAKLGDKGLQDMAEVVNTLTGRGGKKGGVVETHMKSLSTTLFSPRLWASRLNTLNPQYYARLSGPARKEALEAAGSFAAVAGVALGSLAAAGAEVSTDPRSADFLKVKFGDKRYDILGGFQQNLVFAYRELSGEKVNSQTGEVTKFARSPIEAITGKHPELATGPYVPDRLSIGTDVLSNKAAPLPSSALKIIKGKDKSGQDVNPLKEIGSLFVPLNLSGAYEFIQHENGSLPERIAKGTALNAPNTVGVGSQVYGKQDLPVTGKKGDYLKELKSKGAPKEQQDASKSFFQYVKAAPSRDNYSSKIKDALKSNDIPKAESLAQEYNKKYSSSFGDWLDKYKPYANDKNLVKVYNSNKITSASFDRWLSEIKRDKQGGL